MVTGETSTQSGQEAPVYKCGDYTVCAHLSDRPVSGFVPEQRSAWPTRVPRA